MAWCLDFFLYSHQGTYIAFLQNSCFYCFVSFILMPLSSYFQFIDIILDRVINVFFFTKGWTTKQSQHYLFLIICLLITVYMLPALSLRFQSSSYVRTTELCYFGHYQELSFPSLHLFLFTLGLAREQMWAKYEGF